MSGYSVQLYTAGEFMFTKFSTVCTFIRGSGLLPTYPDADAVRYPDTVLSLAGSDTLHLSILLFIVVLY